MSATHFGGLGLSARYTAALGDYVARKDEGALLKAYELGRQALDNGAGVLDITAIHEGALEALLRQAPDSAAALEAARRAWEFLAESLGPFEMAQRSFREANLRLQTTNELLAGRSAELAAANRQLEATNVAIERQRATLAAVIASMTDGLVVVGPDGAIGACNAQAGELLAIDPRRVLGASLDTFRDLVTETAEDRHRLHSLWEQALLPAGEHASFEFQTTAQPPRDILLEFFAVEGDPSPRLGILLRDLTPERQLTRAKDELVAVVTHELRSPITTIVGFADLLLRGRRDPERERQYFTHIANEGSRLAALISDFLDLQRIDRGADRIVPTAVDLRPLLEQTRTLLADREQTYTVVLELPEVLPQALADRERVWQVLTNLVTNACKYSPDGGEIRVAARPAGDLIELSVADQGLGIPGEALPRLFDEFYRVESPDRARISGTGLGLSISRKIVEAHGGRIWAESDGPGRGSRFAFTLPRA
jgi:signal transduction histidine kinase